MKEKRMVHYVKGVFVCNAGSPTSRRNGLRSGGSAATSATIAAR